MNAAVEATIGEYSASNDSVRLEKIDLQRLENVVADAIAGLKDLQKPDGHWLFELEADVTIPAEYVMLQHYLGEPEPELEQKIAVYIRERQADHGGWALFHEGAFDISASVKAYYALKLVGDDIDSAHMCKAREAILAHGGAAESNVFTRIALSLFEQVPWHAVPVMPVEIFHLPRWFPFHLSKVSYWSRTVIAPLLVLMALKPTAVNPRGVDIRELFTIPPEEVENYHQNATGSRIGDVLLWVDGLLRLAEPYFPQKTRKQAIDKALTFFTERLNGEDGLGGIFPAMANAVMAMTALGYPEDHPDLAAAKGSLRKLLVVGEDRAYCQPCLSPVWDTALAALALMESAEDTKDPAVDKAMEWLAGKQILDVYGDWAENSPNLRPGGWAFQYEDPHYPDIDDTAVVAIALHQAGLPQHEENLSRAEEWVAGMQSGNGGWGAFDIDNSREYLNNIPFADHGALLDPPTSDVTARCLGMFSQLGYGRDHRIVRTGVDFLCREQEEDGSWYGRWGTNYIYGTWSVLCGLNAAGEDMSQPYIRKAVDWLKACQQPDGGWGEDGATYWPERRNETKDSTASQTAWALLGLMAAGEVGSDAVAAGARYLVEAPRTGAKWDEEWYTAVGFPRVFYLRYHGYSAFFPTWALARYRNLMKGNSRSVLQGM